MRHEIVLALYDAGEGARPATSLLERAANAADDTVREAATVALERLTVT